MKILIFSDIHNKQGILKKLVNQTKPDYIFFLGDGITVTEQELNNFPKEKLFLVKGNCDLESNVPTTLRVSLNGVEFLLTHGHGYHVKTNLMELFDYAKKENVQIVCFGHTHKAFNESINGIKFFNPGSLSYEKEGENTFGIIEIVGETITQKIEKN